MTAKLKVPMADNHVALVPVLVPNLDDVRAAADELHSRGEAWQGELFGWPAEYNPQSTERPLDSAMSFTPADFCIGESGIWFFSRQWENGGDVLPSEYLDDRNVIRD